MYDFKLSTLANSIELYLHQTYGTVLLHSLPQQPLFSYHVYRKALNAKL